MPGPGAAGLRGGAEGGLAVARAAVATWMADGPWAITSLGGSTGRTWLAVGPRTVVVRLDASADVVGRVAELGVGPAVLASGWIGDRAYVIQERVDAPTPSPRWLAEHLGSVGALFATYQADAALAGLGTPLPAQALAGDLLEAARGAEIGPDRIEIAEWLVQRAPSLEPGPGVASHGDPNSSNFLAGERLLLVDWDDLRRADPLRDLGPFAWWNVAERNWPRVFEAARQPWGDAARDGLFWWAAAESLDVAVRLLAQDPTAAERFFADAAAAARHEANPRRSP